MKSLIHEIHRRSLWQVLGIYLAGSWIALQVVEQLTEAAGLPDWVRPFSLVLLVLGFPIVMATAFVQEGITSRTREPAPAAADVGEVAPPPAPKQDTHRKLLTWRNALLGGGAAFALLGVLTVGYLFMRSSGIGPAGTLVAQGILEEGALVVLADFDGSDAELADVVTGTLRIDLVQSPTIRVVPRSRLAEALRRMQRDEETPITGAVAREIAVREGYTAVIEGEIGSVGSGYVLSASILAGEGWEPQAAFRATASGEDELIGAVEDLSRDIRDKAGESLRSVQGAPALDQVTTTSLEALRLYTRGEELENSDRAGAVELFEGAVEIDPDFAMAHRKIGVGLFNMGIRRQDEVTAMRRAFELRDRLPPAERHLAEGYYHQGVTGDRDATIRAYERLLEVDAEQIAGLNNLAIVYSDMGRFEEAEVLLERALAVESFTVAHANLARDRASQGLVEDAGAAIDEGVARLPASEHLLETVRAMNVLSTGAYDEAEALVAAYGERFPSQPGQVRRAHLAAVLHAVRGELDEAGQEWSGVVGEEYFFAHPMRAARERAKLALVRGDSASAVEVLLDANRTLGDATPVSDRIYGWWLPTLAEAGGVREAEDLYDEWVREVPENELGLFQADGRRELEARLAFARGDLDESIRLWEAFERECPGSCAIVASYALAGIHERRGDGAAAIVEYERYLADTFFRRWLHDQAYRGPTLESLGRLYDGQADAANAAKYYGMLVDLWADADEDLQPRVNVARARLAELDGASQ